jgi:glycosyltransferase involved in cell wall biosynthesis
MMNQFKIVVPSFNSVDYLPKTLQSIEMQTYKNYQVCVLDDASTLPQQREIIKDFCSRNHWHSIFHTKNLGALQGLVEAIASFQCQDNDVIVVIDGDDWLAHEEVLGHLHKCYMENDIYMTWGQCEIYPRGKTPMRYAQPVPDMVIDQKLYRSIPFVFWHPATFKYILWRHINPDDLLDQNQEYFRIMKDKATLFPMLEMCGHKKMYVDETLYIYNIENPLNDYANTPQDEIKRVDAYLQSKPRYSVLECCKMLNDA